MKTKKILALTESASMIALATVLSMLAIIKMPFGGSVTACSMLPIFLIAYRHKVKWGVFTAFVFSVLQMLLGIENVRYGTTFVAVCAIIFLDYIIAFTVLGLIALFRGRFASQVSEVVVGTLFCCLLRYICHFIAGCTVWAGLLIPTADAMVYSLAYNAAYIIPETIVTLAGAWYLATVIDFRGERLKPYANQEKKICVVLNGVGLLSLVAGIVFDALYLFQKIQTEDGFAFDHINEANWLLVLGVLLVSVCVWLTLFFISKVRKSKA